MLCNETTRVQVPALMHLATLGYHFISKNDSYILDESTNILTDSFEKAFNQLNPNPTKSTKEVLKDIKKYLNNDDLGKSFYEYLLTSEYKIIDFDNPTNNIYEMMTELSYKSLRPDITLFINGLPLVCIEVKQPLAQKNIQDEKERHIKRYSNSTNRMFYNLTQIWIFSDNLAYSNNNFNQGVFYSTSYSPIFQRFFEEESLASNTTPPPQKNPRFKIA
ncbi:type I restriction enzyme R protein [Helicobacter cetorum MIT 00-7128]|uniref:type I site-specific deoxyribonuclease n=1 Tax=Helicobacter cetorum (strain ATCC BAA-429 / MIT 00-7128) TaxID=182217 RepID=I0EMC4_HELC0|nr:type I restriction enzyme R protein [Helicobacter cetorum MIT 00-7128]